MIDWYMLLAPLVALPIILLFAFVGCGLEQHGGNPGLTVFLTWQEPIPLEPDVHHVGFGAEIKDSGQTSAFVDSKNIPAEDFQNPGQSSLFFPAVPSDEVITCWIYVTTKTIPTMTTLVMSHTGTPEDDGPHWHFQVTPDPNSQGQVVLLDVTV
jgi:hypothetical protein